MSANEKVGWPANTEDVSHSIDGNYLRIGYEMSYLYIRDEMRTYVKSDVYPHEPEVAPMMTPEYVRVRL
jgi:hypothetical protein